MKKNYLGSITFNSTTLVKWPFNPPISFLGLRFYVHYLLSIVYIMWDAVPFTENFSHRFSWRVCSFGFFFSPQNLLDLRCDWAPPLPSSLFSLTRLFFLWTTASTPKHAIPWHQNTPIRRLPQTHGNIYFLLLITVFTYPYANAIIFTFLLKCGRMIYYLITSDLHHTWKNWTVSYRALAHPMDRL